MTKQEYLAFSLPYRLKCFSNQTNAIYDITSMSFWNKCLVRVKPNNQRDFLLPTSRILPILRPLSDLPRLITQKGYNNEEPFFPLYRLQKEDKAFTTDFIHAFGVEECKFSVIELLLKWHFDLFGGIESGEAINVNTLDINPYK